MTFDPATSDLAALFHDPAMFDSADAWRDAGFQIVRASENKICVACHASVAGYLFKKYVSAGKREDPDDQLDNYRTRALGARRLHALIEARQLRHVAVPRKWIRPLFRSHVLIVDQLDLVDDSERQYARIDDAVLRDLCVALHAFRGLDSTAKNVPFTRDGKVAFIDTEHWDRHGDREKRKQRPFLRYLGEHLSSDSRRIAERMWSQLEGDGAEDDFEEEDTSSSSSSSSSS